MKKLGLKDIHVVKNPIYSKQSQVTEQIHREMLHSGSLFRSAKLHTSLSLVSAHIQRVAVVLGGHSEGGCQADVHFCN